MEKDLVIIGGGPGGYVAAIKAAQLGIDVAIVEKDQLGGTCLNRGCIPTKALYKSSQVIETVKRSAEFGVHVSDIILDFKQMQERKEKIVHQLVEGISKLLKNHGIEVVRGEGSLLEPQKVSVKDSSGVFSEIKTKNILLATGSLPSKPPISGIELPGVLTSDELLEITAIPKSLLIVGGGVIGIEFAGIFQALGCQVTVLEFMPSILPFLDSEISRRMSMTLKRKGIRIETGIKVNEIKTKEGELSVTAEGPLGNLTFQAGRVLIASGRVFNISNLNLDDLGICYDLKGIKVDSSFATNVPGIYAIGDVIGGLMLAHVASEEGIVAVEKMRGLEGHINYEAVPNCIFSFPEIAVCGISEEEAKRQNMEYTVSKFLFGANGKALTMGEGEGLIKVLALKDTQEIIGTHIMGPHASDLIHEAALAITNKLRVKDIINTVHAHPTLSECFMEAVLGLENRTIHAVCKK